MDLNEGRTTDRQWAELLATNGLLYVTTFGQGTWPAGCATRFAGSANVGDGEFSSTISAEMASASAAQADLRVCVAWLATV